MSHPQYQTVKDVADLLKVSEVTVRRWIKEGDLRAIDIGKGWRISAEDLDAFLDGHATRPAGLLKGAAQTVAGKSRTDETKGQKT